MPRAIWSGSISFGLVNVPVKAYTAVRDHSVHFHQLDPKGSRIKYEKVSEKTGKEVDADEIKLGFEVSKGHYVELTKDEVDEMQPASTKSIDIGDFVDLAEIDPIFYDHTYWLAPDGEAATKAYALLRDAMEDEQRVGIGSVVMRKKQYLAAIRPVKGALAMSTMRFADEVVPSSDIEGIPKRAGTAKNHKEMQLAKQIVDALASDWKPERYHDTYTEELRDLIEKKRKGQKITVAAEPEAKDADVVDLMAALEESVKSARGRKRPAPRSSRKKSA
ncbi:MAG TPA: Ku protein [Acidimicrobiales bacterium]|nr:Ku protein [Acidimicrobiales bacterium]